jgi:Core-2/I-Branching enzyme
MSVKIGFAILTHNEPEQLLRLVKTLNAMFGAPPIACHHDFGQCALDKARFPANVRFVHPHLVTRWGDITAPLAALRAFRLLRQHDRPDWYFLLSGSDYPVRPATEILRDLSEATCDAYLDNREIPFRPPPVDEPTDGHVLGRTDWVLMAYGRYCTLRRPTKRLLVRALLHGSLPRSEFVPVGERGVDRILHWFNFGRPSRIYGGDFWFHANAEAIGHLLDDPSMIQLVRYYRKRPNPDESIFHTALCNHPDLKICKNHKRYADWPASAHHPKWLDISDMDKIIGSGAYFARKIRDPKLYDLVETTRLQL